MKTIKLYIAFAFSVLGVIGCSDYLDRESMTDTNQTYEDIFKNPHQAPGFINHAYNYLPNGFYQVGDALMASACDEAEHSDAGATVQLFNSEAISPTYNPDDVWNNMYEGIRICNIFLKELSGKDGLIVKYNSIAESERNNYKGQALFLRAFFHFELAKRYQNIFCVNEVLDPFNEGQIYAIPQSTFRQAVDFIVNDCDSAAKYLPSTAVNTSGSTAGRPTQAAPLALKSRILLYAASPLNNPDGNIELWRKAEAAAKDFYDKNTTIFKQKLLDDYCKVFTTPYNSEIIFATMPTNTNTIEYNNFPISYQGRGLTNPTQELVDSYAMASTSYASPMSGYQSDDPYSLTNTKKRENRFYATVLFNGQTFKDSQVETFVGGKEGLYSTSTATKTGYYLRKFIKPDIDLVTGSTAYQYWTLFRYAEIILNYAEARNEELDSPASDKTIHDLLNLIRNRAGLRPFRSSSEYIKTKEEMRDYIKLERKKELALEGHRFWDMRRWKDEAGLSASVHGVKIEKVEDGVGSQNNPAFKLTYKYFKVENRTFDTKFYWYPIPRSEILKYRSKGIEIKQNPGWE